MIQTCKNQNIIDVVMRHDYWRAVWINNICYFRTFEDNVIYHSGVYIELSYKSSAMNPIEPKIYEMR